MTEPQRVGDLEVYQDLRFQEREWTVQRVGWALMLLVILLALLGLFGTGPISTGSAEADDGAIAAGYERFVRHDGRTTLTLEVDGSQAQDGEIQVWVSRDYIDAMQVEQIAPSPSDTVAADDRLVYTFPIDDPSSTLTVAFSLAPQDMLRLSGEAGIPDGPTISWNQFSYP
jgi:hypothetical protein